MKFAKLTFFFLLLSFCATAQRATSSDAIRAYINELKEKYPVPELSKTEMYADFDTLVSIMEYCNPQYLVRKKVTGYNMIEEMEAQRKHVETCNNTLDFIKILYKVLSLSLDPHCTDAGSEVWHYKSIYKKDIEINAITEADYGINFNYRDDVFRKYTPFINLLYIQGKYCIKNNTTFINNIDSVVIPAGTEILAFNQQPIADIQSNVRNWYSRWDKDKNRYYHSMLYVTNSQNSISFSINNIVKECEFEKYSQTRNDLSMNGYQVKWLDKDSIIYIVIPEMNYVKKWLKQLKTNLLHYKKKSIKAVIVDIRGNYGGSDQVWVEVLEMVSKTAMEFPSYLISNTDKEVIKRIQPSEITLLLEKEDSKIVFECIDPNYQFRVFEKGTDSTVNSKRNLGYEGIIYLLVDEDVYSSAGAFSSLCTKNDSIKTIGMSTGKFLGGVTTPNIFILPHSRLIFRMELLLDAAGVSKAEDFYQDQINYPVTPSIEYYKYWHNPIRSYTIDEKAMYEHDEVFLKALEIIKSKN